MTHPEKDNAKKRAICIKMGKVRYLDESSANASAARMTRKSGYARIYRCEFCRDYHITTKRQCAEELRRKGT